jgi:hypothetical protein
LKHQLEIEAEKESLQEAIVINKQAIADQNKNRTRTRSSNPKLRALHSRLAADELAFNKVVNLLEVYVKGVKYLSTKQGEQNVCLLLATQRSHT